MKIIHTPNAPAAIGPYSQAIVSNGTLYVSGQIPVNPATGAFSGDTIAAQAEQSCKNVGAILEAAGVGFDKVVKTCCFLADMADFAARACVAVKTLPKGALCEIEAVAEL